MLTTELFYLMHGMTHAAVYFFIFKACHVSRCQSLSKYLVLLLIWEISDHVCPETHPHVQMIAPQTPRSLTTELPYRRPVSVNHHLIMWLTNHQFSLFQTVLGPKPSKLYPWSNPVTEGHWHYKVRLIVRLLGF